jgi:hypothetical protein
LIAGREPIALPGGYTLLPPECTARAARVFQLLDKVGGGLPEPSDHLLLDFFNMSVSAEVNTPGTVPQRLPEGAANCTLMTAREAKKSGAVSTLAASKKWEITDRGVRDLCRRGVVAHIRVGRRYLIAPDTLASYIPKTKRSSR